MELNLALPSLVNAAGAFVYLVAGLAILAIARGRSRRGLLVGCMATTFGLTFVVENLLDYGQSVASVVIVTVATSSCILSSLLLSWHLAIEASAARKRALAMVAGLLVIAMALIGAVTFSHDKSITGAALGVVAPRFTLAIFVVHVLQAAMVLLLAACAVAFQSCANADLRGRRALAALALAFGPFALFINVINGMGSYWIVPALSAAAGTAWVGGFFLRAILVVVAAYGFIGAKPAEPRLSRLLFGVLLGVGASAVAMMAASPVEVGDGSAFGTFGILRMASVVALAFAVVKYDLLGVPLPHLATKRGVAATAALASLFVVAQVAQNFFAAEYGLIMGGVVAGTVVFAASPIQRAMERASDRKPAGDATPTAAPAARRERTYRNALRFAMRDRTLTAEEESHLFELAEDLGIGAGRAFQLKKQVEEEVH